MTPAKTHKSALVIIPPQELWEPIQMPFPVPWSLSRGREIAALEVQLRRGSVEDKTVKADETKSGGFLLKIMNSSGSFITACRFPF